MSRNICHSIVWRHSIVKMIGGLASSLPHIIRHPHCVYFPGSVWVPWDEVTIRMLIELQAWAPVTTPPRASHCPQWSEEWGRKNTNATYSGHQAKGRNSTYESILYRSPIYINCFHYFFHLHYMSFSTLPIVRNEAKPPSNLRLIGTNLQQLPIGSASMCHGGLRLASLSPRLVEWLK